MTMAQRNIMKKKSSMYKGAYTAQVEEFRFNKNVKLLKDIPPSAYTGCQDELEMVIRVITDYDWCENQPPEAGALCWCEERVLQADQGDWRLRQLPSWGEEGSQLSE